MAGFFLMILQGISELIKRIAYLKGLLPFSAFRKHALDPAEEIAAIAQAASPGRSEKQ